VVKIYAVMIYLFVADTGIIMLYIWTRLKRMIKSNTSSARSSTISVRYVNQAKIRVSRKTARAARSPHERVKYETQIEK